MNAGSPTLGQASIPGDADGLRTVANRFQAARIDVTRAKEQVENDQTTMWSGDAAERYRATVEPIPLKLAQAAGAFELACSSMRRFTTDLTVFQDLAAAYAARIEELEGAAEGAQERGDQALVGLEAAKAQQAAAADPVSLKSSADAVTVGLALWRRAIAELEEHEAEIAALRRRAEENRAHYDASVSACRASLEEAQASMGFLASAR